MWAILLLRASSRTVREALRQGALTGVFDMSWFLHSEGLSSEKRPCL